MEKQKLTAGARTAASGETPVVRWVENGEERSAAWRSEAGVAVPKTTGLPEAPPEADTSTRRSLSACAGIGAIAMDCGIGVTVSITKSVGAAAKFASPA